MPSRSWSDPPLVFHIFLLLSSVRRNLGSLGSLDFLPSSSLPSLFLGGLRSGLFWDIVALLVFAPIVSTPRHLHADRWDHASPSRFFFDPLTVCTCAGGVIGFAVVVFSCSRLGLGSICGVNGCSWLAGCVWCCAWVAVVQQIHDSVDGIEAWQCRIWCEVLCLRLGSWKEVVTLGDRSSSEMMALVWGELVV
ncbi:hypothetical protein ACOSQ3_019729 [Xanthoceras sorbifolium]